MLTLSTDFDFTYFLTKLGPAQVETESVVRMPVRVFPTWFVCARLEWDPLDSWAGLNPRYNVYRSETQDGNYELLTSSPITDTFFVDNENFNSSKFEIEYWVIEIILDGGVSHKTAPIAAVPKRGTFQNNRATEINRREWVLLRKFTGMDATILRRKKHGQRCPVCWDPVSKKVVGNKCQTCYDVGFTGGYYSGMTTKIQFDARIENKQYTYFGKFEANQIGAWTIAYPDIQPHDLIIRHGDHKVYRVEQIQNTELLGNPVRQIMRITELAKEGVEYALIDREAIRNKDTTNGVDLTMGLPYE